MGVKLRVEFDNPDKTYFPGQVVRLKAIFAIDKSIKVRQIECRFLGYAETSWSKLEKKSGKKPSWKTYGGRDEYFRVTKDLIGQKDGPEIKLAAGEHTFDVDYKLPADIPPSFHGEYGTINYNFKIDADISWGLDKGCKEAFFVQPIFDLNLYPLLKQPVKIERRVNLGGCCGFSGRPIQVMIELPRSGVVPGEALPITVECSNSSIITIKRIKVKLMYRTTYSTRTPTPDTKVKTRPIAELAFNESIQRSQFKTFQSELPLDDDVKAKIELVNNCALIESQYALHVLFYVRSFDDDVMIEVPITIGNVAFNDKAGAAATNGGGGSAAGGGGDIRQPPPYNQIIPTGPLPGFNIADNSVGSSGWGPAVHGAGIPRSPPSAPTSP